MALLILALCVGGCGSRTGIEPVPERHTRSTVPFDLWKNADGSDRTFEEYVSQTKRQLNDQRWTMPGESSPQRTDRIESISPYEWPRDPACGGKASTGVLLIHGLTDSPYLMRDLGDFFHGIPGGCYLVRSILLPGHGTRPGDLLDVKAADWAAATRYGIRSFAGEVRDVHIVGFSTGGALALYEALAPETSRPEIRSLILFSPVIRAHGAPSRLPLISRLIVGVYRLWPPSRWMTVAEDKDYAKYESFAANAAYQILVLDDELATRLARKIPVPVFAAVAADDQTVSAEQVLEFFLRRPDLPPPSHMVLYVGSGATAAEYRKKYDAHSTRVTVVDGSDRADPHHIVMELAHMSTPVAPENRHYGVKGDYANCLHYLESGDWGRYCACLPAAQRSPRCPAGASESDPETIRYGERTDNNVARRDISLRRQTYNPRFKDLLIEIQRFLGAVEARSSR